jgi:hypothetical protein
MCLDVTDFMKDNMNARKDLADLCDRPNMEARLNARGNLRRTKAPYCLKPTERKEVNLLPFCTHVLKLLIFYFDMQL